MPNSDSANTASVPPMVTQRNRSASIRAARNQPATRRGFSSCRFIALGNSSTPTSGANSTATTHEISSAAAITQNRLLTYSPALLLLSRMGVNPATVTSVPVSIGKAVEV